MPILRELMVLKKPKATCIYYEEEKYIIVSNLVLNLQIQKHKEFYILGIETEAREL